METFFEYCKNHILNNIEGFEGNYVYGADFCYDVTMAMNTDGTATYSRDSAKEYLKEWWNEAADYYEYHKSNFGEAPINPFEDPEGYMVCMVICGCSSILSQCKTIDDRWNNQFTLDKEIIAQIKNEVEEIDKINF